MSWTDKRVAKLEKLWKEGKSAADIAKSLGGGVTRNAVIGKAHRLGLSGRPQPAAKKEKEKAAPAAAKGKTAKKASPKKDAAPPAPVVEKEVKPVADEDVRKPEKALTILDLTERTCKWPIGDPRFENFYFCGGASRPGTPYCDKHAAMAYQTASRKQDAGKAAEKAKAANAA